MWWGGGVIRIAQLVLTTLSIIDSVVFERLGSESEGLMKVTLQHLAVSFLQQMMYIKDVHISSCRTMLGKA